jgi:hypothetical protein
MRNTKTASTRRLSLETIKYPLAAVALAMFATVSAASAQTQTSSSHHPAAQPYQHLYMSGGRASGDNAPAGMNTDRATALRECSEAASKFKDRDFETQQAATFGTCMTQHGQTP